MRNGKTKRAYVIGSGPNGLAAAVVLAEAGLQVEVFEAEAEPGGAARSLPLTLPGFLHDFGSAVHPLAAGSPIFSALPLSEYGLEWIHGDAPLAHPLDDGSAVMLERSLDETEHELGDDSAAWRNLMEPAAQNWQKFTGDALAPILRFPRHPFGMARFGLAAFQPARMLAKSHFKGERARALFAGLAGHSFLSFSQPLSSAIALVLGAAAHAVGWPIPRGGARAIPHSLVNYLETRGGTVHTSRRIGAVEFAEMAGEGALILCDLSPGALSAIAGDRVPASFRRAAGRFRHAPGAFKIDYALSDPVPWQAPACRRAITVHVGGAFEEIAASEEAVAQGRCAERPFVLAAQPTLFDSARAPQGKHILWTYCHVPNGSSFNMTERIESQIERFAPGFRDCVLARHVAPPSELERMDANLVGGDISGGALNLGQLLFRPSFRAYSTGTANIYLCSASTPPGGGVHGMCGYFAAKLALKRLRRTSPRPRTARSLFTDH